MIIVNLSLSDDLNTQSNSCNEGQNRWRERWENTQLVFVKYLINPLP
jgi:hypothetical protein